jgi:predicted O-linked N-acetylglucosamine transferase (SPINDLY family)
MKLRDLFRSNPTDTPAPAPAEPQAPAATQELLRQAQTLHGDGRLAEAASVYQAVLALDPQNWASSNALASIGLQVGELDEAIQRYGALIECRPDFAEGHYKRGNAYNTVGRLPDALADYDQAIALDPGYANAYCNRGTVLGRLERWDEALASYDRALTLNPKDAFAHYNRADVLRELKRSDEAIGSYDQAIALNGAYVEAYVNRGHLLHKLLRHEQAAASYGKALELCPILPQAARSGLRPAALRPEQKYLLGLKRYVQMQICDWQGMNADLERIAEGLRAQLPVTLPLPALAMLDNPALHRAAAESWIREESPPNPALGAIPGRPRSPRIRIGYFSGDFRIHPVAYLTAGLFEHHDRSRFELTAFAFGPQSNDAMQVRISKAFDRFLDVRERSDVEVAALARDLGIDIAVNLSGMTEHSRSGIFALRAAPIQINYLGYPGTMGAGFMDYLIADSTVVPRAVQGEYAEKIVYLPGSFMPFDSSYAIAEKTFTREQLGLPAAGFVYCCFNNSFKLTPNVFDHWMRILTRTENSVLWLAQTDPAAAFNLRKEASRRGVDERRLIFADRIDSLPEHLARLRAADLFLDTFPYNAHATSLDALWAGLPVLTCAGESFPSRVAASLLRAIGLPGLIARSLSEYEEMAVDLAADAARLGQIRWMLAQNRSAAPLFDTARYTKDLEVAYEIVYDRHHSGATPGHVNEHLVV